MKLGKRAVKCLRSQSRPSAKIRYENITIMIFIFEAHLEARKVFLRHNGQSATTFSSLLFVVLFRRKNVHRLLQWAKPFH